MGHKVSPKALRLGINKYWSSRWFFKKPQAFLEADYIIRKTILESFEKGGIVEVIIERKSPDRCKVIIETAKPGFLIGREGQILKNLIKKIEERSKKVFEKYNLTPPKIDVDVLEAKKPFMSAVFLAEIAANELAKGMNTRKVLKRLIERAKQHKEILGVKTKASGRLEGSTIKKREIIIWGRVPTSKFTAEIDYAQRKVLTKYGYIGLKIWLYKGDKEQIEENVTT